MGYDAMRNSTIPDSLFRKYQSVGQMSGNELLLSHADALKFISDCQREGLIIVGMDFYIVDRDRTIGLLNSGDFSPLLNQTGAAEKSTVEALSLIQDRLPDGANRVSFVVRAASTTGNTG